MEEMREDSKINSYEISFLVNASEGAEAIKKLLADLKAEIITEGPVAEIQLAYPIEKKTSAFFGYTHFKLATEKMQELNDTLRLDKGVLRFLVITPIPAKPIPRRMETTPRPAKKAASNDLSNEALEEKLAALQGNA